MRPQKSSLPTAPAFCPYLVLLRPAPVFYADCFLLPPSSPLAILQSFPFELRDSLLPSEDFGDPTCSFFEGGVYVRQQPNEPY